MKQNDTNVTVQGQPIPEQWRWYHPLTVMFALRVDRATGRSRPEITENHVRAAAAVLEARLVGALGLALVRDVRLGDGLTVVRDEAVTGWQVRMDSAGAGLTIDIGGVSPWSVLVVVYTRRFGELCACTVERWCADTLGPLLFGLKDIDSAGVVKVSCADTCSAVGR